VARCTGVAIQSFERRSMNEPRAETRIESRALELFTRSLDQPAETRDQWLIQECAGSEPLLTAVHALVDADRQSRDFLEKGPRFPERERSGERVGNFELLELIGQGGMGSVYRARRADGAFEQIVAIKLFRTQRMNRSALQRFETERRILAKLEHPGIARLIDGGEAADGTPYVAMERIEGVPITEHCDREALNLVQRIQLIRKVCAALSIAHRNGIVHRDLKPSNILVTSDGQPKLIDFGIAKVLDPDSMAGDLPVTRIDTRAMTPDYASPEQVRNHLSTAASDVYALGVLSYELLTGTRPYQVDQVSPLELDRIVCEMVPADPSTCVRGLRAETPAGLPPARSLASMLRGDLDRNRP
jgi:serine/threonine protein kinase